MTLTTEMIRAGQDAAPQLSAVEIAAAWRAMCAAAPVAAQAQPPHPTVTFEMARKAEQVLVRGKGPNYRKIVADAIEAALDVAQKDGQFAVQQPVSGAEGLPVPYPNPAEVTPAMRAGFERLFHEARTRRHGTLARNESGAYRDLWVAADWLFYQRAWADALAAQPQPSGNAVSDDAMERALSELVDKIVPGLDTGDLVADAATASKSLDRGQPSGNASVLPKRHTAGSMIELKAAIYAHHGWTRKPGESQSARISTIYTVDADNKAGKFIATPKAQPSGNAGELPDERASFEWWASDVGTWLAAVERSGNGYKLAQTDSAWRVWQARAALAQQASGGRDWEDARQKAIAAMELALSTHGVWLTSYPPKDAWEFHRVAETLRDAIKAARAAAKAQP